MRFPTTSTSKSERRMLVFAVVLGSLAILGGLAQPYFESRSFNKLTGGSATYWDALWSELRVDGSSQR